MFGNICFVLWYFWMTVIATSYTFITLFIPVVVGAGFLFYLIILVDKLIKIHGKKCKRIS